MEDIEDLIVPDLSFERPTARKRNTVLPRARKQNLKHHLPEGEELQVDSVIPGTQSVYVRTWGCSHNSSDGEYMAGQLAAAGYHITEDASAADLWLLNSCTVKNPAEDHFRNAIRKAQEQQKKVVVAGCVSQAQPKMDYLKNLSIIGVQQIDRVVEVVDEAVKGHSVRLLGQKKAGGKRLPGARLDLPKIRRNPLIEILSINTGCLNACTYCKTKHARGDLSSYSIQELVERARQSFQGEKHRRDLGVMAYYGLRGVRRKGVCELWLTSEDTGAYGKDIGTNLPLLLTELVKEIPEGAMLRLGMTNPPYILEHLEAMVAILQHPRVYSFLHVPVQSGSDSVLMEMRREYCSDEFKSLVEFLKKRVPGITIATDIICGFPGETEEDFQQTMGLVKQFKFPSLFINQFYPRPGTPAARMPQIPAHIKKQRTKELSALFHSYNPYDHKVGERQKVLVTEESFDSQYYVAHNKFYEQVLVPKRPELMGKMLEVQIYEAGKHFMKGRLLDEESGVRVSIATPLAKGQVSGVTQELKAEHNQDPACSLSPGFFWRFLSNTDGLKLFSLALILATLISASLMEKLL
ncbi:hypothetical protein DNTS_023786 [Danionella cerebrum]|uniref:Threonylcarbamoyladenosine tRNA methylthiotransferase n=1 Tax=Danionella cerebrum TaxID=2873325 RepID=A0A553QV81_9TELE|nr:hypothetical protein DNTS_023786 [Danionella translucida]